MKQYSITENEALELCARFVMYFNSVLTEIPDKDFMATLAGDFVRNFLERTTQGEEGK